MLTGEGGDNVLGPGRLTPLARQLSGRRLPTGSALRAGVMATLPPFLQEVAYRRPGASARLGWLTPAAAMAYRQAMAADRAATPARWDRMVRQFPHWRAIQVGLYQNLARLGASQDVLIGHPLLDDTVVDAISAAGGAVGFHDRPQAMRALFGDELPAGVGQRRTKVNFRTVYVAEHTNDFVTRWDGSGLDTSLVDPCALRAEWTGRNVNSASLSLLQAAWLSSAQREDEARMDRV